MSRKLALWVISSMFVFACMFFFGKLIVTLVSAKAAGIRAAQVMRQMIAASDAQHKKDTVELRADLKQLRFDLFSTREEFQKIRPDITLSYDRMTAATFVIECYGFREGPEIEIPGGGKVKRYVPFAGYGAGLSALHHGHVALLTTRHNVVFGAGFQLMEIRVTFPGHAAQSAKILGDSVPFDVARIKLEGDMPYEGVPLLLDAPIVGDFVAAIGTPIGFRFTVIPGWVSTVAPGAYVQHPSPLLLIANTAITNGNSGGPIISIAHETIVGMSIAKPKNWPMAMAIPGHHLAQLVDRLATPGSLKHGAIGLGVVHTSEINDINASIGGFVLPKEPGVIVAALQPDGPAHGKLIVGDVIRSCNGIPIMTRDQLEVAMLLAQPGDKMQLELRRGTDELSVEILVGELVIR